MKDFKTLQLTSQAVRHFSLTVIALVAFVLPMEAQNVIRGIIRDASGEPLPGVSVVIKGRAGTGAVSNADGIFMRLRLASNLYSI